MKIYYVYILRCPDTDAVRYVGCTAFPTKREREHCDYAINNPNTKVRMWLRSLREQGKRPVFEIVESGYGAFRHEAEWIGIYNARGCDLLNVKQNDSNPITSP